MRSDAKWKSVLQEGIKYIGNDTYVDNYKRVTFPLNFLKTEMTVHNYIMRLIKG